MTNEKQILISEEDALLFEVFKKHKEKYIALLSAGVFSIEVGRAEISINNGQIHMVHIRKMTYKRIKK